MEGQYISIQDIYRENIRHQCYNSGNKNFINKLLQTNGVFPWVQFTFFIFHLKHADFKIPHKYWLQFKLNLFQKATISFIEISVSSSL